MTKIRVAEDERNLYLGTHCAKCSRDNYQRDDRHSLKFTTISEALNAVVKTKLILGRASDGFIVIFLACYHDQNMKREQAYRVLVIEA